MKIYLEVGDFLKRYTAQQTCLELDVAEGITATSVIRSVGVPEDEIGFIAANGQKVDPEYILKENDRIKVFPVIIGG